MLPKQGVLKTKGQEKSDIKLCQDSVRKARGISSTTHNKAADLEDDILRLRKIKLQLENIKLRMEIKSLRKDLDKIILLNSVQNGI